ncbi:transposable element Tcb1 transposase [Trichonephila clavipes]|uniref:Transposable element Tcb1 transposase n=1 Tax=Trichonephila clavipes TaxID=2585209 RepID=A0A8X6S3E5_TRICX|nr:transposable element Tcb1 transposase [Trichonephila clavipes]
MGKRRRLRRHWREEPRTLTTKWNDIMFSDESRFCLQHHDDRIRLRRHHGERPLSCCVMHHHTAPAPDIMVCCGIGFHCRTPLVRIAGTLYSQRYLSEVWEAVVLPYIQCFPPAIFPTG